MYIRPHTIVDRCIEFLDVSIHGFKIIQGWDLEILAGAFEYWQIPLPAD